MVDDTFTKSHGMAKQLHSSVVTAVHVNSFVFVDSDENVQSSNVWHTAALHDINEDFDQLSLDPADNLFECLSRYSVWFAGRSGLQYSQLSLCLSICYFLQWVLGRWMSLWLVCGPYSVSRSLENAAHCMIYPLVSKVWYCSLL